MRTCIVAIVMLFPLFAAAQDSKLGNWMIYFGNLKLSSKLNWHHEVQYRNFNAAGDLEQLLLRTGIGYNLTENNNNLLLGYGYIISTPYISGADEKRRFGEHRLFQQFITRQHFGRVYLQHRYRLEQRFIEDTDFRMRFRYFLLLNIPLNKPALDSGAWYLSAYNELFINHRSPYFDRNRAYAALGYCIGKYMRVELGWMRQQLESTGRNQFQVVMFNNLPWR